jgi:hypothetical protein
MSLELGSTIYRVEVKPSGYDRITTVIDGIQWHRYITEGTISSILEYRIIGRILKVVDGEVRINNANDNDTISEYDLLDIYILSDGKETAFIYDTEIGDSGNSSSKFFLTLEEAEIYKNKMIDKNIKRSS